MENNRIDLCAPEGETPIYDQIRQELAGRIRAGSLPDGTRLPTVRELSEQLHVAEGTVKRAYDELERDGLLIKTPGRGSFVCYRPELDRRQAAQEQTDALNAEADAIERARAAAHGGIDLSILETGGITLDDLQRYITLVDALKERGIDVTNGFGFGEKTSILNS